MESKVLFCKKCHTFITQYIQDTDGIQVIRNGVPSGAKIGHNFFSKTKDSQVIQGFPIKCLRGHVNFILEPDDCIKDAHRLQYKFGQSCRYHRNHLTQELDNALCTVRQPCETCICYSNYRDKIQTEIKQ
jgi:hypothetical protein